MRQQLARLWSTLNIIAETSNGLETLEVAQAVQPDIVFLDIRMPALSGIEVARQLKCHIVFITAYDEYAIQAFEHAAIDYLLKPVETERLQQTVARLQQRLTQPPFELSQYLQHFYQEKPIYLQWFKVQQGEEIYLLSVDEVDYLHAQDKYTSLFTLHKEWLLRTPLKTLEEQLDPQKFWRIHRSTLVRVAAIAKITRHFNGKLSLFVLNHDEPLIVSRAYAEQFRA